MAGSTGKYPEDHSGLTRTFQKAIPCLLVLSLFILTSACLHAAQPAPAVPENGSPGADTADNFLLQNVVNISAGDSDSTIPEDRTAAAIRDAIDSRDQATRDAAVALIMPEHGGTFRTSQLCDLWDAANSRWTYVEDPDGSDYFSPASRTITLGFRGDCDDFAVVVAAMIESVGGDARVVYATNGTAVHAYPEVFIGTISEEFERAAAYIRQRYHVTGIGCHITRSETGTQYWLNLDWWSRYPGGIFFADDGVRTAYYPDGRWEQVES